MTNILLRRTFTTILLALFFLFLPVDVHAQQLQMSIADHHAAQIGGRSLINVSLSDLDAAVNGIEGEIVLPGDGLEIEDIYIGDSVISHWIQRPAHQDGVIRFSGINPGGIPSGHNRPVFTIALRTNATNHYIFNSRNVSVFKNDGFGTRISLADSEINLNVSATVNTVLTPAIHDTTAPEPFIVRAVRIPEINESHQFLVFHTEDNGSGVKKYILRDGFGKQKIITSPYMIQDGDSLHTFQVVAEDYYGNQTIGELRNDSSSIARYAIVDIIALLVLFGAGVFMSYRILPAILYRKYLQ